MAADSHLTLYHAPMSRSVRVRWCLEEMGTPHTVEHLGPITGEVRGNVGGDAYRAIHPLQKVPALKDGDDVMLESVAMLEYLTAKYGPTPLVVTPDEPDFGRYLEWLHFGEATMSMSVNLVLAHTALLPEAHRNPALAKWARAEVDKQLKLLSERGLEGGARTYLAGDRLTLADMSLGYMLLLLKIVKQFDGAPEPVRAYFDRLRQLDSWKRATAD
jgi:glutathione S-transferase